MYHPSLLAHLFGALIMLAAFILIALNFKRITSGKTYDVVVLLLLLSTVITLHGISHLGLERTYGFNPLQGLRF